MIAMVKIKKENETNRERFIRLAENRTQKVIEALRILGNCKNLQIYKYNKKDIDVIFNAIDKQIKKVKNGFLTQLDKLDKGSNQFSLKLK